MKNKQVMYSSSYMEWETPKEIFKELDKEFNFTLDFCASEENAKCDKYYSVEDNALIQNPKDERIFCNPPYGNEIKKFVRKCWEISKDNLVVMLIPARTDTTYFHNYIYHEAEEIRFIKGRIKFNRKRKENGSAPFPSMIVVLNRTEYN